MYGYISIKRINEELEEKFVSIFVQCIVGFVSAILYILILKMSLCI